MAKLDYLIRAIKGFKVIIFDKNRKSILRMLVEYIITALKTKSIASHYFTDFLYRKSVKNYLDYHSHKEIKHIQNVLCNNALAEVLGNKLLFQEHYEKSDITLPKLLGYNYFEQFILIDNKKYESYDISNADELLKVFKKLLKLSSNGSFFIKPIRGSGGHSAKKIKSESDELNQENFAKFHNSILSGFFIFQDEVVQHKDLMKLHPTSLNTMRIDTFKIPGKQPEIISAFIRLGIGGNDVDNLASGGIIVSINLNDGTLKKEAFNQLAKEGKLFTSHPTTGVMFEGFKIPFFEEAKKTTLKAAKWLPEPLVGWDIAISDKGPVLTEGNWYYGINWCEVAYGGYRKNPVFKKVTNYIKHELKK